MADVARRIGGPGDGDGRPGRTDRAQLILVAALALAILFVALALILNTAIYTENLATRSSDIGGGTDAVRYHDAARDGVGGVMSYVNAHNNSTTTFLVTNLSAGVSDFSEESARQFAISDRAVETHLNETVNGTRVAQTDPSRNFSNVSGTPDWEVTSSAGGVRAFRMQVSTDLLVVLTGSPFEVRLDDGTDTWTMNVSTTGTDVVVTVGGTTGSGSCSTPSGPTWINVTAGTLAGEPCEPLESFADGVGPTYAVSFANADNVNGTYSFVVDDPGVASSADLASPGSGQPHGALAVYATTVDVYYETPRLYYEATVRVAPGEPE